MLSKRHNQLAIPAKADVEYWESHSKGYQCRRIGYRHHTAEILVFLEGDPENWTWQVERYFHQHPADDEERQIRSHSMVIMEIGYRNTFKVLYMEPEVWYKNLFMKMLLEFWKDMHISSAKNQDDWRLYGLIHI